MVWYSIWNRLEWYGDRSWYSAPYSLHSDRYGSRWALFIWMQIRYLFVCAQAIREWARQFLSLSLFQVSLTESSSCKRWWSMMHRHMIPPKLSIRRFGENSSTLPQTPVIPKKACTSHCIIRLSMCGRAFCIRCSLWLIASDGLVFDFKIYVFFARFFLRFVLF